MDKKTLALMAVAVIYWLFPDVMPGLPIDDLLVTVICALLSRNGKEKKEEQKMEIEDKNRAQ